MYDDVIAFIKQLYKKNSIPLHAPVFYGNEKKYLNECIDTTFVSSVGKFVDQFEEQIAEFTGAKRAVAVVNGTNALQTALRLVGVEPETEVITQPLTFVATCNAIKYLYADPVFVDVDRDTMGLSPNSLCEFLYEFAEITSEGPKNKETGKRIAACVPMHTYGHPTRIQEIVKICRSWNIPVIEDAAESLGSYADGIHTGLFGDLGVLSFNGNKTITTGGGGMLITQDENLGNTAKHITTTAKVPHKWEFFHDELGYNFRMPNINAALGCAQLEKLPEILKNKRNTAAAYQEFFSNKENMRFFEERKGTKSNYWLNVVLLNNKSERDTFLQETNDAGIMTRPVWTLMHKLPVFKECFKTDIPNAEWLEERVVNLPSSVGI